MRRRWWPGDPGVDQPTLKDSAFQPGCREIPKAFRRPGSSRGARRELAGGAGLPSEVLNSDPLKCKSICQSADSPFSILPCGDRVFKNGFHTHLKIPGTQTGWVPGREEAGRATLLSSPVPSQLRDTAPSKLGAPAWSLAPPHQCPPTHTSAPQHTPLPHRCPQLILGGIYLSTPTSCSC